MSLRIFVILSLCLVSSQANRVNAGETPMFCTGNQTACDQSCFVCEPGCDEGCYCCRRGCLSRWCHWHWLDSTCDMYPHYAYYPENHGYYYYRPYNWEHYGQDTPRMLGVGYAAPYAVDGFNELKPSTVIEQPVMPPRRKPLPNLEVLLKK